MESNNLSKSVRSKPCLSDDAIEEKIKQLSSDQRLIYDRIFTKYRLLSSVSPSVKQHHKRQSITARCPKGFIYRVKITADSVKSYPLGKHIVDIALKIASSDTPMSSSEKSATEGSKSEKDGSFGAAEDILLQMTEKLREDEINNQNNKEDMIADTFMLTN